jgi:hypothetical protein
MINNLGIITSNGWVDLPSSEFPISFDDLVTECGNSFVHVGFKSDNGIVVQDVCHLPPSNPVSFTMPTNLVDNGLLSRRCLLHTCVNGILVTGGSGSLTKHGAFSFTPSYLVAYDTAKGSQLNINTPQELACNTEFGDLMETVGTKVVFTT